MRISGGFVGGLPSSHDAGVHCKTGISTWGHPAYVTNDLQGACPTLAWSTVLPCVAELVSSGLQTSAP